MPFGTFIRAPALASAMQYVLILLVAVTLVFGAAASVTVSLAPAYADDSGKGLLNGLAFSLSKHARCRRGKGALAVLQGEVERRARRPGATSHPRNARPKFGAPWSSPPTTASFRSALWIVPKGRSWSAISPRALSQEVIEGVSAASVCKEAYRRYLKRRPPVAQSRSASLPTGHQPQPMFRRPLTCGAASGVGGSTLA